MLNRRHLSSGSLDNNLHWLIRGFSALIVTLVVFMVFPKPLCAADDDQSQDIFIGEHDYILDKQDNFNCSMVKMSDDELSEVTAAGFSSFTLQDNVTKAYFNVDTATFTEINSMKMGYYNDGTTTAWDEDWTQVSLGSPTESLKCKGIYIEASFSSITSSTARTLNSIKVGTPAMTGPITATFNSFSGRVENGSGTPVVYGGITLDGHRITGLGTRTIYSNNSEFYMQLSSSGAQKGWWFFWKNATVS